jgi:hypothetical protein
MAQGELWQMASAWLKSLGVLTPDSPALIPQARVYDLALALQVKEEKKKKNR